jgi:hypothetical protein
VILSTQVARIPETMLLPVKNLNKLAEIMAAAMLKIKGREYLFVHSFILSLNIANSN